MAETKLEKLQVLRKQLLVMKASFAMANVEEDRLIRVKEDADTARIEATKHRQNIGGQVSALTVAAMDAAQEYLTEAEAEEDLQLTMAARVTQIVDGISQPLDDSY